jgi:hypothetical protein
VKIHLNLSLILHGKMRYEGSATRVVEWILLWLPTEKETTFGRTRSIPQYAFAGRVVSYDEKTKIATVEQRNHFRCGEVEFFGPGFNRFSQRIDELWMRQEMK